MPGVGPVTWGRSSRNGESAIMGKRGGFVTRRLHSPECGALGARSTPNQAGTSSTPGCKCEWNITRASVRSSAMPRPKLVSDTDILAATRRVMLRDGAERFTLADVAREVGLSRAALIQRFANKAGLEKQVAASGLDALHGLIADSPITNKGPRQVLGFLDKVLKGPGDFAARRRCRLCRGAARTGSWRASTSRPGAGRGSRRHADDRGAGCGDAGRPRLRRGPAAAGAAVIYAGGPAEDSPDQAGGRSQSRLSSESRAKVAPLSSTLASPLVSLASPLRMASNTAAMPASKLSLPWSDRSTPSKARCPRRADHSGPSRGSCHRTRLPFWLR